ncbi:MAG: OsmC family protein, partial [Candidatus Dormibacteraeota bacterium]|nr:OsmC family protein [Candidatus Dormibacteraeota bacterium]
RSMGVMSEEDLRTATLRWQGTGFDFEGTTEAAPVAVQGGPDRTAASPMELLLVAAAGCMAIDVVDILTKGRRAPASYEVEISGVRRATPPRRYTELRLRHTVRGADEASVRRAVDLSQEKYCSVMATLDPGMPITHEIVIHPG